MLAVEAGGFRAFVVLPSSKKPPWFEKHISKAAGLQGAWKQSEVAPPARGVDNKEHIRTWRSKCTPSDEVPPEAEGTYQIIPEASTSTNELLLEGGEMGLTARGFLVSSTEDVLRLIEEQDKLPSPVDELNSFVTDVLPRLERIAPSGLADSLRRVQDGCSELLEHQADLEKAFRQQADLVTRSSGGGPSRLAIRQAWAARLARVRVELRALFPDGLDAEEEEEEEDERPTLRGGPR